MKRFFVLLAAVLTLCALSVIGVSARENTTVYAPYFNVAPTIDGVISTAEWGQPTGYATVYTGRNDYKYDDDDNVKVSDFCFYDGRAMYINDISFDFWLRWDEKYFYIGMVSKDKYGYARHYEEQFFGDDEMKYQDLWNGDSLQFGLDPQGANSNGNTSAPCGEHNQTPLTYVFGWVDKEMTQIGMRNDSDKSKLIEGFKGGLTWNSGVWPSFGGQANSEAGYITYEVALPYSAFDGTIEFGKTTGYGITLSRVSATPSDAADQDGNIIGSGEYDCWLSWGDGVMGSLKDQLPEYRCGANCVILVDDPALGASAPVQPIAAAEEENEEESEKTEAEEPADEAEETEAAENDGEDTATDETDETKETEETEAEETADVTAASEEEEEEKVTSADAGEENTAASEGPEPSENGKEDTETGERETSSSSGPVIWIALAGIAAAAVAGTAVGVAVKKKKKN